MPSERLLTPQDRTFLAMMSTLPLTADVAYESRRRGQTGIRLTPLYPVADDGFLAHTFFPKNFDPITDPQPTD